MEGQLVPVLVKRQPAVSPPPRGAGSKPRSRATASERSSGRSRRVLAAAASALRDADVPVVGVAGGEGTVRTVAQPLAGGEMALAVLPMGSLNHFARRIGVPDLDAAAEAIANGDVAACRSASSASTSSSTRRPSGSTRRSSGG
jgi:diacylglycerol kinase family enzyme